MFGDRGDGTCVPSLWILAEDSNIEKSVRSGSVQRNENTAKQETGGGGWLRRTLGTSCQAGEPALYQICTRCGEKMSVILNMLSSRFVGIQTGALSCRWVLESGVQPRNLPGKETVYNMLLIHGGGGGGCWGHTERLYGFVCQSCGP